MNLSIRLKLYILIFLSSLILLFQSLYQLNNEHHMMMEDRKTKVASLTESATTLIKHYYQMSQKGTLSESEAKSAAMSAIKSIRYDNNSNYLWINDTEPKMIMHSMKPALDGKNLSKVKDPNGTYLFNDMVKAVSSTGEGYVPYMWPKPGKDAPQPKLSHVRLFKPWNWIVGTGIYIDDVNAIYNKILTQSMITLVIAVGILFAMAIFLIRGIIRQIADLNQHVGDIIGQLDFSRHLESRQKNELSKIYEPINRLIDTVRDALLNSREASEENRQAAIRLNQNAHALNASATKLRQMNSKTEGLVKETAGSLDETEVASLSTVSAMKETSSAMEIFSDSVLSLRDALEESSTRQNEVTDRMIQLSNQANDIKEILGIIGDIADQTNLLALNAAIEAARAGEHGRGFAVVSDEVRKLAERTQKSLSEINSTTTVIVQMINDSSESIKQVSSGIIEVAEKGSSIAEEARSTREKMSDSVQISETSARSMSFIATKTKQLMEVMEESNKIAMENENIGDESAAMSEEVLAQSESIKEKLSQFKL